MFPLQAPTNGLNARVILFAVMGAVGGGGAVLLRGDRAGRRRRPAAVPRRGERQRRRGVVRGRGRIEAECGRVEKWSEEQDQGESSHAGYTSRSSGTMGLCSSMSAAHAPR